MTRTWKLLGLQAVVALALTAPRLGAVEEGLPKTDSEKLDAALQKLTQIQKSLDELEKLRRDLRDLRGDTNVTVQKTLEDVSGLKTQVAQIRRDLEELRGRLGPTTRTAGYPPDSTGRVMLVNEYPVEMEVIVNQTSYRVAPNMTREVALPAGTFTFRVPNAPGFEAPQSRVLPPNHNYRITIHP